MSEIAVEATRTGYFGTLREPGDVFMIPNLAALGSWMKRVDSDTMESQPTKTEPVPALEVGTRPIKRK